MRLAVSGSCMRGDVPAAGVRGGWHLAGSCADLHVAQCWGRVGNGKQTDDDGPHCGSWRWVFVVSTEWCAV